MVKRSSISQATSYTEIGEYWVEHDVGDVWNQTKPAEFDVDIQRERTEVRTAPSRSEYLNVDQASKG